MNTQQQAYIEGFVKRAAEYGFDENEAIGILKEATRWRDEFLAGNIDAAPLYRANSVSELLKTHDPVGVELRAGGRMHPYGFKTDHLAWKKPLSLARLVAETDGKNIDVTKGTRVYPQKGEWMRELAKLDKEMSHLMSARDEAWNRHHAALEAARNNPKRETQRILAQAQADRAANLDKQLDKTEYTHKYWSRKMSDVEDYEKHLRDIRKGLRARAPESLKMQEIARKVKEQAAKRMAAPSSVQTEKGVVSKLLSRIGQVLKRKGK